MTKPTDFRSHLDTVKHSPHCFKMIKELMERHDMRAKSLECRSQLLKDRRKSMYQNEYERIEGILAHTVVPETKKTIQIIMRHIEKFELACTY